MTENASRSRGRPKSGIEMFTDPHYVGTTRISLGANLDRHVMAIQTTRMVQHRPIAVIFGYWAGRKVEQDQRFFKQMKGRRMKELKKTHWLIIMGDFRMGG